MTPQAKKQSIELINALFRDIPDYWHGFILMRDDLFELNIKSERTHRKNRPNPIKGFTVNDAAKYFTVKFLYDACKAVDGEGYLYGVADMVGTRYEALRAQGYVMRKRELFDDWKELVKNSDFESIDYCELVN